MTGAEIDTRLSIVARVLVDYLKAERILAQAQAVAEKRHLRLVVT